MLELISTVNKIFHRSGVQPPLWNTGTTYNITLEQPLDGEQASRFAVRFFLAGLYARIFNVQLMYFYNWGSPRVPLVPQAEGGAPTQAEALANGRLMVTAALSMAVACTELGGETGELTWLIYDRDGPLKVLPLALGAMEVGTAASGAKTAGDLEAAQVVHEAPHYLRDGGHLRPGPLHRPPHRRGQPAPLASPVPAVTPADRHVRGG